MMNMNMNMNMNIHMILTLNINLTLNMNMNDAADDDDDGSACLPGPLVVCSDFLDTSFIWMMINFGSISHWMEHLPCLQGRPTHEDL